MKTLSLTVPVFATLLGFTATASAETWKGEYKGAWVTAGGTPSGKLGWKAQWSGEGISWTFAGSDSDDFGASKLTGTCDGSSCTITQHYDSGKLAGQDFTWKASYSDEAKTLTETVNTLKGSWEAKDGSAKGTFDAKGECKKQ